MRFKFGIILGIVAGAGAALYLDRDPHFGPLIDDNWPIEESYAPNRGTEITASNLPFISDASAENRLDRLNVTRCFSRDDALSASPPRWLTRPNLESHAAGKSPKFPPPNLLDYPGLVKIETIRGSSGTVREHCAGARIGENWIVSAAHCVLGGPAGIQPTDMIIVSPRIDVHQPSTPITPVSAAYCHGAYNHSSRKFDDDITLIYVEDSESLAGIDIVDIDRPNDQLEQDRFMQTRIAGWGKNGENRFLQGGRVNLTNIGQILMISENIGPVGPCVGDSGGPLYVSASGASPIVGGLLQSVTRGDCPADNNAFFLRLQSYATWIDRIVYNCDKDGKLVC